MSDQPTKKWLQEQIAGCQLAIAQNQGAINLCVAMLEKGIFMEDKVEVKSDGN